MLTSGDVVALDFGVPAEREAGFRRPAVVVTAQRLLDGSPAVVQVVPVTSVIRGFDAEVLVEADPFNGLAQDSAVQCHHVRAVATTRIERRIGHVGPMALGQIREVLGRILDIPE